ncbi:calcyphosin-like protein isoform X1 [Varroa jacobsoni]|uniref:EF-hand domain-containing protein n=2 Tax=Varroa destructor TaxID=109461 RepID=A0A7M7KGM0_VARDE|nr:calcyphosin-like protein isoform X1 [Varroa destructor]XP_022665755.1 calcyphosin-like protein isoform X1 [Varroa destructor]XP_022665763.1 calcyphosin-like protein isoform X1 [Varroa destructor]XP_022665772.1 calcyphosin-like protein isoform X1 [Varroa destructor]XP_022665782.1 calcyphosin-like protein isoform X1 [Varroa destructor]XP_022702721.1 calcyphosin-like protein isoform X1 [Varroa jacobsoni]XP_022702723.1 calcyphosin-like protein isoform X1 [Varroa jacobsoni]XP_022702724.1 calcy
MGKTSSLIASKMPRPLTAQSNNELQMRLRAQSQLLHVKDVLEKIRLLCLQRGASGILGLRRMFLRMDDNNSGDLSRDEFAKGLDDSGLREQLSDDEARELFDIFDSDHSGTLSFDEFLKRIRPPLNATRISVIEKAFKKMDKTGDGVVTYEDVKGTYNVKAHPDYQNGTKTEREILTKFLNVFEQGGIQDGKVTWDEFLDYYSGVSASIDEDLYFDLMMRNAWKL